MAQPGTDEELARADALGRKLGVGCFTGFLGAVSFAMVAAYLSKLFAILTRAKCEVDGIPSCNWHYWAAIGAAVGAVTLPTLVLSRLGRPKAPPANTDRG